MTVTTIEFVCTDCGCPVSRFDVSPLSKPPIRCLVCQYLTDAPNLTPEERVFMRNRISDRVGH